MDNALQGGRIVKLSDKEIFFTHGDWFQESSAQDKKSIFGVDVLINVPVINSPESSGFCCLYKATPPATRGVAIEVPVNIA